MPCVYVYVCVHCGWRSIAACLSAVSVSPCWQVYLKSCCCESPPNTLTTAQREKKKTQCAHQHCCLFTCSYTFNTTLLFSTQLHLSIHIPIRFRQHSVFTLCIWDWVWRVSVICLTTGPLETRCCEKWNAATNQDRAQVPWNHGRWKWTTSVTVSQNTKL